MIKRGLKNLMKNPQTHYTAGPVSDDIFHWEGVIFGPIGTPYEGGVFKLTIHYPPGYPLKPPHVAFKTAIYHPNVSDRGNIFLKMLLPAYWSAEYNITTLLETLVKMLTEPELGERDNFVVSIAQVYNTDQDRFNERARDMTISFAGGSACT